MGYKNENENEVVPEAVSADKDLISSDDVLAVVSGNHIALIEQLERAKQVALEQLEASKNSSTAVNQKQLEEELKRREEELAVAKRVQEDMKRKEEMARQEAERKKIAAEQEARRKVEEEKQKKIQEEEEKRKQLAAQELVAQQKIAAEQEIVRLKQEKENQIQQVKLEKEQKKLAKQEAIKQRKLAREEAKTQRQLARKNSLKQKEEVPVLEPIQHEFAPLPAAQQQPVVVPPSQAANQQVYQQPPVVRAPMPEQSQVVKIPEPPQRPIEPILVPQQKQALKQEIPLPSAPLQEKELQQSVHKNGLNVVDGNKSPKSNLKYWMTLVLFICLFLIVIFLPQISEMISKYQDEKKLQQEAVITTGNLKCTLLKSDDKYDFEYNATFSFRDSQMYRLSYILTTKGDRNEDALELTEMKKSCDVLKAQVTSMEGVDVSCSLSNGVYINEQVLKYDILDSSKVTTAYLEAGGTYPNYTYQQEIDEIEKQMKASGYKCVREH